MSRNQNKEQLFSLLGEHRQQFQRLGVKRFGLFGSFAQGQQHQQSDVDLRLLPSRRFFLLVSRNAGKLIALATARNYTPRRLRLKR